MIQRFYERHPTAAFIIGLLSATYLFGSWIWPIAEAGIMSKITVAAIIVAWAGSMIFWMRSAGRWRKKRTRSGPINR